MFYINVGLMNIKLNTCLNVAISNYNSFKITADIFRLQQSSFYPRFCKLCCNLSCLENGLNRHSVFLLSINRLSYSIRRLCSGLRLRVELTFYHSNTDQLSETPQFIGFKKQITTFPVPFQTQDLKTKKQTILFFIKR